MKSHDSRATPANCVHHSQNNNSTVAQICRALEVSEDRGGRQENKLKPQDGTPSHYPEASFWPLPCSTSALPLSTAHPISGLPSKPVLPQQQSQMSPQALQGKTLAKSSRGKYHTIPFQTRSQLLSLVIQEGLTVYRASRMLGLNNSTAKVIIRRFKRTGKIFCRKSERRDEKTTVTLECPPQPQLPPHNQPELLPSLQPYLAILPHPPLYCIPCPHNPSIYALFFAP